MILRRVPGVAMLDEKGSKSVVTPKTLDIVLEVGTTRTFATAADWPGWSRSGKSDDAAIGAMLDYQARYAEVVELAGVTESLPDKPEIVERVVGDATTNFGAPGKVAETDRLPIDAEDLERRRMLLQGSWGLFDLVVARVTPEMKKGPRGGGRDRDGIMAHVIEADRSYARKIGVRTPPFDPLDRSAALAHREAVLAAIPGLQNGFPPVPKGWPVRYAIARMAWHILDHAWEMEDKSLG